MLFLLNILVTALISHSFAAPVSEKSVEATLNTLNELASDVAVLVAEVERWRGYDDVIKYESPFFENTILPGIEKILEIMDTPMESPEYSPSQALVIVGLLHKIEELLEKEYRSPNQILDEYRSFDGTVRRQALNRLTYSKLIRDFKLKRAVYNAFHDFVDNPTSIMITGLEHIEWDGGIEKISHLYETMKSAEETMSQNFETLRKNVASYEQIVEFIGDYVLYFTLFSDIKTPILRAERVLDAKLDGGTASEITSKTGSSSKLVNPMSNTIYDFAAADPKPNSNPQEEGNDSSQLISDSTSCDPGPSSKRHSLPQVPDNFNPESNLPLFAFETLLHQPTIALQEKLDQWRGFVRNNQPIDQSDLLSALKDCMLIMEKIEPFITYFPICRNDYEFHKSALQTLDGFHDLIKQAAMSIWLPDYFDSFREKFHDDLPDKVKELPEEIEYPDSLLSEDFFDNPIFIKFCLDYSRLLLQNNCRKLRMKSVSMIAPKDFVNQNFDYVQLIAIYEPMYYLLSVDQNVKKEEEEIWEGERILKNAGIVEYYITRFERTMEQNIKSLLKDSLPSFEVLEQFLKFNFKFISTELFGSSQKPWMEYHVPKMLDFQPIDIHVSSSGNLYIDYNPNDRNINSRRLYNPICPAENVLGHIQPISSN